MNRWDQETTKSNTLAKRLEQQGSRIKELEESIFETQKSVLSLEGAKELAETELAQLQEGLREASNMIERLNADNERLRMRPGNRIFRPVGGSTLEAMQEKIDFTKIQLRQTSSRYLAEARKESITAEISGRERAASFTFRPSSPGNRRLLPMPNFDVNNL